MIKLRILQTTVCGGQRVEANAIVDASERDAHILLTIGKACLASEAPESPAEIPEASESTDNDTDASIERAAKTAPSKAKAK